MRRGFTLIELIVALFVGSLILLAAAQAVRYSSLLLTRVQAHYQAETGGELGTRLFAEEMRLAEPHLLTIFLAAPTPVPPAVTTVPPAMAGPGSDSVPLVVAFRPKGNDGTGMAGRYTMRPVYVIYFYDQTQQEWLRGEWTKAQPDNPIGHDARACLPPLTTTNPVYPSITSLLSGTVGTPGGLDHSPQILTRNVTGMSVTPAQWPGAPYVLTQGVALSLTVHYDYTSDANAAGLQSIESSFTKTFVTCAFPRNEF
ncbi:MAG: PulJ/GspJ family protein [Candidatus Xenobia bacterium]